MESEGTFKSRVFTGFLPVSVALLISTAALLQFGAPSDESLNLSLLLMATLTFFLAMTLLPLRLVMRSTKPLNPTIARLTNHVATATLTTSFITLIFATAFTKSTISLTVNVSTLKSAMVSVVGRAGDALRYLHTSP